MEMTFGAIMKALAYQEFGPPDSIAIVDMPCPLTGNNEVLVKVAYAGINPIDWKIGSRRIDHYRTAPFPLVTGRDVCGTVVEVGRDVRDYSVGERVIAALPGPGGAFAEYVAIEEKSLARAPGNLSMAEAASFPLVGLTCWQALVEKAGISAGDILYVLSGAGGTGSIAIQLAVELGAKVVTTCSEKNRGYVAGLGARKIHDYSKPDVTKDLIAEFPNGVDAVFSNVLGPLHREAYRTLRPRGTLVTIGEAPLPELAAEKGVREIDLVVRPDGVQLSEIVKYIETGTIKPPTVSVYPMAQGANAMLNSFGGHVRGKIVLQIE
jgi:NADPH2:quinone reductase